MRKMHYPARITSAILTNAAFFIRQASDMTSLILISVVVGMFALLLTWETITDDKQVRIRPAGLLTWITSGNWPAKVGAGLLIVGIGALLRYALINIEMPPELKLGSGIVAAAVLGFISMLMKNQPGRRAIHLSLAGAAFGVAYLTAYAAYGFFNYIVDYQALILLALVAIAAGYFSVTTNAVSVAVLAMLGAYIAPKFAIGSPTILPVYGYYLAISVLTLAMITARGWRPLIHLSFLFTLAGALFFGWNGRFHEPEHYALMQPLLLALTLVHALMPLLERKYSPGKHLQRFDTAYFVLLPLVSTILTIKIAPDVRMEGALGLGGLALIWATLAIGLRFTKRPDEAASHGGVALLLAMIGIILYVYDRDLPWLQIGLAILTIAMFASSRQKNSPKYVAGIVCGSSLALGLLSVLATIFVDYGNGRQTPFLNPDYLKNALTGSFMLATGLLAMKQSGAMARTLVAVGGGLLLLRTIMEFRNLELPYLAELFYLLILILIVARALFGNRPALGMTASLAILYALHWLATSSAQDAHPIVAQTLLILTPFAMLFAVIAHQSRAGSKEVDRFPLVAIGLLPVISLPWAAAFHHVLGGETILLDATIAMAAIAFAGAAGRIGLREEKAWNTWAQPAHAMICAAMLAYFTLAHIERGMWPVLFEIIAIIYLLAYALRRKRENEETYGMGVIAALAVALSLQTMILRAFGPDIPVMNAMDMRHMELPAVVSLMWALYGAGIAWWGSHSASRGTWTLGSVLLTAAAVKLVLFDFSGLGQLGNIIAFIIAGLVFLGVAWLAPIPPRTPPGKTSEIEPATVPARNEIQA